ncbi:MAG: M50 family metallopeptidase [Bacteroidota bacterium]
MRFKDEIDKGLSRGDKTYFLLWSVAILTVVIWNIPIIRWVQYPFLLLGTWFHEMGHGMIGLLLGAKFHELKIFANGSGFAMISTEGMWIKESWGNVLIGLGGLIGPSIAGGILIISGRQKKWSRIALISLATLMILTVFIWVRTLWGIIIINIIAAILLYVWWKGSRRSQQLLIQYLGIQASLTTFLQISYLFTEKVTVGDQVHYSDTARIALHSFGNYFLWGIIVSVITIGILWFSFRLSTKDHLRIEGKRK